MGLRTLLPCGVALAVACAGGPASVLLAATPVPEEGAASAAAPAPGAGGPAGEHTGHGDPGGAAGGSPAGGAGSTPAGAAGEDQGAAPAGGREGGGTAGGPGEIPGMTGMPGMEAQQAAGETHAMHGKHAMPALLGPYSMTRESSGTSWQPESSPHEGLFTRYGPWALMLHGMAFVTFDDQGGQRGDSHWFSGNMLMGMMERPLGPGRLGLRAMVSAEPWTIGRNGYPLLLQTGETANGRTELVDRQHPHDLFDELAVTYSVALGQASSLFAYAGLPGEPALGPPTYMHRFSAMDNPETPLGHHWLDSTHISYGVTTVGWVMGGLKLEGSAFRGREPDQHRADIESPKLDSYSFRLSYQPDPGLAVQASYGHLKSPEQLEPDVDVNRSTVSVMYNAPLAEAGNLQSTLAWGRNQRRPGRTTNAYLFEGAAAFLARHTVFYRLEELENDELIADVLGPSAIHKARKLIAVRERGGSPPVAVVTKIGGGYVYDALVGESYRGGPGFDVSVVHVPQRLETSYGGDWVPGWMIFFRLRLGNAAM
jgi:hypothetical protein